MTTRVSGPALLALFAAAGCQANPLQTYPVNGRVVTPDGSPFAGSGYIVTFRTGLMIDGKQQYVTADAPVSAEGTFRPSTFRFEDGLVAGRHDVTLAPLPVPAGADASASAPAARISAKYAVAQTSGLSATVTPDSREVVLTVELKR